MSKKTKRLEKENQTLTRKQEATNRNILEMAEERTKAQQTINELRKDKERLEKICRAMQAQGRGQAPLSNSHSDANSGSATEGINGHAHHRPVTAPNLNVHGDPMTANYGEADDEDATEDSDYYDEDEDGSEEYDDETEEESIETAPRPFGPVPPPPPPPTKGSVGGNAKNKNWAQQAVNGVVQH